MADVCDTTDHTEERIKQANIDAIRAQSPRLTPMGHCYNCDEVFPEGSKKLFCDSDCAMDWEKFQ